MKKLISGVFFLIIILLSPIFLGKVEAGYFTFDPTSSSVDVDGTFQVDVIVNAGSDTIRSTDIYVVFDSNLLEAQSVSDGTFFPTVTNNITSGRVYIAGMVDDGASTKTGSGTVATITFKGLKEGTGSISVDCTNSLIVQSDANGTNLLDCDSNGTDAVTIGSGSSSSDNSLITPTSLPKTGVFNNTVKWSQWGMLLVLLGGVVRLLLL